MCNFLQTLTAKRSPNFYNITKSQGKVVRFCLFKQTYKLGEDIVGTFDFSEATVPCVQVKLLMKVEFSKFDNKSGKCTEPTFVHHIFTQH
jgi:Rgp1.